MRHATLAFVAAVAAASVACESNPTHPEAGHESGTLSVELSYSPDHVHLLQSEVTFRVAVTDDHGDPVTDFETIQVERRAEGSDTWRAVELQPAGDAYEGTYLFASSGEYHLRVSGQRHGQSEMSVLHEMHETMHVARAHAEAGPYRIEFESFPGHVHEGEEVTLTYWIMEPERNDQGERPPVGGLHVEAHVATGGAQGTMVEAHEHDAGVYEAHYPFDEAGTYHVGLHLEDPQGNPIEADFEVHVVHGH